MAIYSELDAALEQLKASCNMCGTCCTFPPGAPVLYATSLERRVLALIPPPREVECETACPYMDPTSRTCGAREHRTLGCRTHFCADALPPQEEREVANELNERGLGQLRNVIHEHGLEWDYAPVIPWLKSRFGGLPRADGSV
jgi:Fe-S-cluster containining protein